MITEYLNATLPTEFLRSDDLQQIGIAGFFADARITQSEEKTQGIPNIPLEDGSFLNDHLIKQPSIVTIEGSVTNIKVGGFPIPDLPLRTPGIPGVNSLFPSPLTAFQQDVSLPAVITTQSTPNLYGIAPSGLSVPEQFVDHINRIHDAGIVIDIETPFAVLTNMALLTFSTTRTNEDDSIRYVIRAQQLEFVKIKTTAVARAKPNPSGSGQASKVDKGEQQGEVVTEPELQSTLTKLFRKKEAA